MAEMNFSLAQGAFINLVNSLRGDDRSRFLSWCQDHYFTGWEQSKAYFDLRTIAEDIKSLVPMEAVFPSEHINTMTNVVENCREPVIHVDSFLFEDDHVDALVEEGKLSRNFCKKCGSVDIAPITFISHSASTKRIAFIFHYLLPDLKDKVLLDVGSRLGAILYGAYYCSAASKIIGVEMNEDLCKLQKHIIDKYQLNDRIEIIHNDICSIPEVIQMVNVIIFNNVFESFMPKDMQEKVWIWLRNTIKKPGTILVTVPTIEETLEKLQTGITISDWLRKIPVTCPEAVQMDDEDLLSDICSYVVI